MRSCNVCSNLRFIYFLLCHDFTRRLTRKVFLEEQLIRVKQRSAHGVGAVLYEIHLGLGVIQNLFLDYRNEMDWNDADDLEEFRDKKKHLVAAIATHTIDANIENAHEVHRKFVDLIQGSVDDWIQKVSDGVSVTSEDLKTLYSGLEELVVTNRQVFVDTHEGRLHTHLDFLCSNLDGVFIFNPTAIVSIAGCVEQLWKKISSRTGLKLSFAAG
jgi:hypothetical protein